MAKNSAMTSPSLNTSQPDPSQEPDYANTSPGDSNRGGPFLGQHNGRFLGPPRSVAGGPLYPTANAEDSAATGLNASRRKKFQPAAEGALRMSFLNDAGGTHDHRLRPPHRGLSM